VVEQGLFGEGGQELLGWKLAKLKKLLVLGRAGNPGVGDTQQCPVSGCMATDQAVVHCHFVTCCGIWSLKRAV